MKKLAALALALALGCSNKGATKTNVEAATTTPPVASSVAQVDLDAAVEAAAPPPEVLAGADYAAEAKALFRIAACGNASPVPEMVEAPVVDAHCKELASMV